MAYSVFLCLYRTMEYLSYDSICRCIIPPSFKLTLLLSNILRAKKNCFTLTLCSFVSNTYIYKNRSYHTPLYKNKQNEREISQWRQLLAVTLEDSVWFSTSVGCRSFLPSCSSLLQDFMNRSKQKAVVILDTSFKKKLVNMDCNESKLCIF